MKRKIKNKCGKCEISFLLNASSDFMSFLNKMWWKWMPSNIIDKKYNPKKKKMLKSKFTRIKKNQGENQFSCEMWNDDVVETLWEVWLFCIQMKLYLCSFF